MHKKIMKRKFLTIFAVFFLVTFAGGQSSQDLILEPGVAAHKGLDEVYLRFSAGYRNLDPQAVSNLYTEDAFYLSPDSDVKRGREKILAEFSGFFDSVKKGGGSLAISFQILGRQISGDLAYDVGIYTLTRKNAKGEARAARGKFIVVARRASNGEWRFQVDGYSGLPSPATSDQKPQRQTDESVSQAEMQSIRTTLTWQYTKYDPDSPLYQSPTETTIYPQDLEKLLDPIFAERMEKLHIPGAAIAVVKDGKIIFAKGYGVSDLETKSPVVADKTIFRIGSITKVFTANAVMQLADQKKIKLSDDVNKYLKGVRVPDTFAKPITFAHLLTHTSGLDEISPGRRTSNEAEIIPLGAFLKDRIVRQFPPGEIISYTTYNPALAAFALEQITSTPFKIYLEKNIFEPLAMNRTSITAVKKEYRQDLATGYEYAENKHQKLPFQWFHTYPASDINSTVTDMARFMLAHLALGELDGKRILSEKAAREMHRSHFRNHPKIPGWAYGFYEGVQNDLRFIEHGGSMDDGYSALMTLLPEKNLGIFVACNTETGGFGLAGAVKNAFLNRYFPAQRKTDFLRTKNPSPESLKKFAGKYKSIIHCHTCAPNTAYVPQPFEVKVTDDGMLSFLGGRWKQLEPMLFVLADGERAGQVFFGFKENAKGEIAYLFQEAYMVSEKVLP